MQYLREPSKGWGDSRAFSALSHVYRVVRRSGILKTSYGRGLYASAYFLYKRYEDRLEDLLRAQPWLIRGGNALDVGANIGYTACVLARAIDRDRLVYAFEPEPVNYGMLQRTASRPRCGGRVVPRHCAVGAADGEVRLWLNAGHPGDHRVVTETFKRSDTAVSGVTVPVVSVDTFVEGHPGPVSFVKIDVQGYEQAVCTGMEATLDRNPEIAILLEYAPECMIELGFSPPDLLEFMRARDFACFAVGPKGRVSARVPVELAGSSYVDLLFTRHPERIGP
jgi:FkbM family methyltransferase